MEYYTIPYLNSRSEGGYVRAVAESAVIALKGAFGSEERSDEVIPERLRDCFGADSEPRNDEK